MLYILAVGCPDPVVPSEVTVIRENGESAMIYCNMTGEKRYLVCKDGTWTGQIGACPQSVTESGPIIKLLTWELLHILITSLLVIDK